MAKESKEVKQGKTELPDSVEELLAASDVRQMVEDFIRENIADCVDLIILWRDKDKNILVRTNLEVISAWKLFFMGLSAQGVDGEGQEKSA